MLLGFVPELKSATINSLPETGALAAAHDGANSCEPKRIVAVTRSRNEIAPPGAMPPRLECQLGAAARKASLSTTRRQSTPGLQVQLVAHHRCRSCATATSGYRYLPEAPQGHADKPDHRPE